jgi:hypothetical protein
MRRRYRPAYDCLVALGEDFLDGKLRVRERGVVHLEALFEALETRTELFRIGGIVTHIVRTDEVVNLRVFVAVPNIHEFLGEALAVHASSFFG